MPPRYILNIESSREKVEDMEMENVDSNYFDMGDADFFILTRITDEFSLCYPFIPIVVHAINFRIRATPSWQLISDVPSTVSNSGDQNNTSCTRIDSIHIYYQPTSPATPFSPFSDDFLAHTIELKTSCVLIQSMQYFKFRTFFVQSGICLSLRVLDVNEGEEEGIPKVYSKPEESKKREREDEIGEEKVEVVRHL
jgi:hypothetical protein